MKTRDGVTLNADIYRPAGDGNYPVLLAAHALQQGRQRRLRPQGRRSRLHGRHPGCPRPLHLRGRVVSLQARDRRRLRHRRVGRGAPALQRQSRLVRRILRRRHADARRHQPSAPSGRHLPRRHRHRTTTKTGPTRAAHSSSGSTSRGPPASRRTPLNRAASATTPMPSSASRVLPLTQLSRLQYQADHRRIAVDPRARARISSTGCAHPTTTAIGSSGPSKKTTRTSRSPRSPSPPGTTSFRAARCATISASRRMPETRPRATGSICSSPIGGHAGWSRKVGNVDFGPAAAFRRERHHTRVVRLPVPGQAEPVRERHSGQDFRDGQEPVARSKPRGPSRAPPRPTYYLHSDGQGQQRFGRWRAFHRDTSQGSRRHFYLRPGQSRSHRGRPALLRFRIISPPGPAIRKKWKPAPMCSSTPPRRSIRMSKSPAPSRWISSRSPPPSTPTSPAN